MTHAWAVPKIWDDATCAIIGGGPTVPVGELERLRGTHVIAVNSAFSFVPWAEVMYYGDCQWSGYPFGDGRTNKQALIEDFPGLKITGCANDDSEDIHYIQRKTLYDEAFQTDPSYIGRNRSSGGDALNIAYHLGARRIVLFGYDCRTEDIGGETRAHFHRKYKPKSEAAMGVLPGAYQTIMSGFTRIAPALRDAEVEVLNASPGSAVDAFPIVSIEDGLVAAGAIP